MPKMPNSNEFKSNLNSNFEIQNWSVIAKPKKFGELNKALRVHLDASHALSREVLRQLTCGDRNGCLGCGYSLNCERLWRPHLNAKANNSHPYVVRYKLGW
jgi:hypothetical protein